ncbi:hypothetical protein [Streptomyces sp. NPDC052107]|uniref:hypothetical protein n=1 Tax=Streptomyces sp. NPDC052107 TaxID=3155632 RepID=UPI00344572FC
MDDEPDQAVDAGPARLPQGRGPALALVLVGCPDWADRDVEFAAAAVSGVQARSPLPRAQVDYPPAVTPQHPRGRHRQALDIEPGY